MSSQWPVLGCGAGLRAQHYPAILKEWPKIDWFEAISENFMDTGGRPLSVLLEVRKHYPIALHGVSLSIGSCDSLDINYLERLKTLIQKVDPVIVSDHLCWSGVDGMQLHDLFPIPFTKESLDHLIPRIQFVQEFLGRRILIENVSSYMTYRYSEMEEWEFLVEVARRSGCGILLDLNNIFVNSKNHGFDPLDYLNHIPAELVGQFHLAGHTDMGSFLFDTHSKPVIHPVWDIYREALKRFGKVATLIEWDEDLPDFGRLREEVANAEKMYQATKTDLGFCPSQKIVKKSSLQKAPSLMQMQRWIKSRVLPKSKSQKDDTFSNELNLQNGVPGVERILVYAEGYEVRIHDAMAEGYPAIQHLYGHEKFIELTKKYMQEYPSHYYNLTNTGQHLADYFLSHAKDYEWPFLADLANLEWQISKAFHSFEAEPFKPAQLAGIPLEEWDKTTLHFQPSVSLIQSRWSILDLWKVRTQDHAEIDLDKIATPQKILIARQGHKVRTEILDDYQYRLIRELLNGKTLGAACEALAEQVKEDEDIPIAQWFSAWVRDGLISSCSFSSVPATK